MARLLDLDPHEWATVSVTDIQCHYGRIYQKILVVTPEVISNGMRKQFYETIQLLETRLSHNGKMEVI